MFCAQALQAAQPKSGRGLTPLRVHVVQRSFQNRVQTILSADGASRGT